MTGLGALNPRFGIASHKSLHDGIFRPWLSLFASTISRTVTGMDSESFSARFKELRDLVDTSLAELLEQQPWPDALRRAISYSLMAGGKRLRPALVLMGCQICGGNQKDALPAAHAVEMIHTYSLIHDDLPCMDDDNLRRGKPANHIEFGESTAVLAGDALQLRALQVIIDSVSIDDHAKIKVLQNLLTSCGYQGMILGQELDMLAENDSSINVKDIHKIEKIIDHTGLKKIIIIANKIGLPAKYEVSRINSQRGKIIEYLYYHTIFNHDLDDFL